MFNQLKRIVKDVTDVTVKPALNAVEQTTAPIAGAVKPLNDMMEETTEFMRGEDDGR